LQFSYGLFLNLGTHVFFAGVVAAIFTGNPYFILLAGIGSSILDLGREYLFVSFTFPFNPLFVLIACHVLAVEAVLVRRLNIRGGNKALV
jgi:hypothetical protein